MVVQRFPWWVRGASPAMIRARVSRWSGGHVVRSRAELPGRRMGKFSSRWLLVAGCLAASGCAGTSTLGPIGEADQTATIMAAVIPPHLQAGEKIRVTVYGEASL